VPEKVVQRILRHANVNTTATYYIKGAADDVQSAMETQEKNIPERSTFEWDTRRTLNVDRSKVSSVPN
jgi:integrase